MDSRPKRSYTSSRAKQELDAIHKQQAAAAAAKAAKKSATKKSSVKKPSAKKSTAPASAFSLNVPPISSSAVFLSSAAPAAAASGASFPLSVGDDDDDDVNTTLVLRHPTLGTNIGKKSPAAAAAIASDAWDPWSNYGGGCNGNLRLNSAAETVVNQIDEKLKALSGPAKQGFAYERILAETINTKLGDELKAEIEVCDPAGAGCEVEDLEVKRKASEVNSVKLETKSGVAADWGNSGMYLLINTDINQGWWIPANHPANKKGMTEKTYERLVASVSVLQSHVDTTQKFITTINTISHWLKSGTPWQKNVFNVIHQSKVQKIITEYFKKIGVVLPQGSFTVLKGFKEKYLFPYGTQLEYAKLLLSNKKYIEAGDVGASPPASLVNYYTKKPPTPRHDRDQAPYGTLNFADLQKHLQALLDRGAVDDKSLLSNIFNHYPSVPGNAAGDGDLDIVDRDIYNIRELAYLLDTGIVKIDPNTSVLMKQLYLQIANYYRSGSDVHKCDGVQILPRKGGKGGLFLFNQKDDFFSFVDPVTNKIIYATPFPCGNTIVPGVEPKDYYTGCSYYDNLIAMGGLAVSIRGRLKPRGSSVAWSSSTKIEKRMIDFNISNPVAIKLFSGITLEDPVVLEDTKQHIIFLIKKLRESRCNDGTGDPQGACAVMGGTKRMKKNEKKRLTKGKNRHRVRRNRNTKKRNTKKRNT